MRRLHATVLWSGMLGLLVLGGCGSSGGHRPASSSGTASAPAGANGNTGPGPTAKRGGYYMDDGPGENPPPNLEQTPDAVPRNEPPLKSAANRPYVVFGKTYTPTLSTPNFRQRGVASWYGRKFHGQKTSSGEAYDMYGMSAAHPTLPIPSYVRVTNLANNRSVVVRVNDRGPFHSERIIDLSYTAALKLGYVGQGSAQVEIEQLRGDGSPPPPPVLVASSPAAPAPVLNSSDTLGAPRSVPAPAAPPVVASTQAAGTQVASAPAAATPPTPPGGTGMPSAPAAGAGAPVAVTTPVAATSATQAPAAQALPTSTQPDGIYLQLGAFGAREGADEFRTKVYQQLGWLNDTIYIVARDRLFRVQLGPYKDRAEAGAMAEKIRQSLQMTPVFVLK